MTRSVVTGANRGIGLELVRQLAARGDSVVAACRETSPGLSALHVDVYENLDVSDEQSVAEFAGGLGDEPVDMLINNAGVLTTEELDSLDWGRMRHQFEVNALGPLRVTSALIPRMAKAGKIGILSSRVGSLQDNSSGGMYGYRMSKAAVNMAGVNLAHDLKPRGIAVFLFHPGYVKTGMTHGQGYTEPEEAARGLIERMDTLTLADTGTFWHANGEPLPW
jgi:NAD(P)-dependent dehydrogenase (short-subunit alcohol dehydrogenase family)